MVAFLPLSGTETVFFGVLAHGLTVVWLSRGFNNDLLSIFRLR